MTDPCMVSCRHSCHHYMAANTREGNLAFSTSCSFSLQAYPLIGSTDPITNRMCLCPIIGSANRKIDIFKSTYKLQSCVGVGLIKKKLEWQQISSMSSSENNVKYLELDRFFTVVICNVILLGQNSLSSFKRLSTLTMEYR